MENKNNIMDLQACKDVAIAFLNTHWEPSNHKEFGHLFVMHPFYNNRFISYVGDNNEIMGIDIMNDKEDLYNKKWIPYMTKRIQEANRLEYIFYLMNGPYMMNYLRFIEQYIYDKRELASILRYAWSYQEFPNWNERGHTLYKVRNLFSKVKDYIMTPEEQEHFDGLPDVVTIYRGQSINTKVYNALSWTDDYERAFWFATRFEEGKLLKATIKKEDIICYLDERGENELIINFRKIQNLTEKVVKKGDRPDE